MARAEQALGPRPMAVKSRSGHRGVAGASRLYVDHSIGVGQWPLRRRPCKHTATASLTVGTLQSDVRATDRNDHGGILQEQAQG